MNLDIISQLVKTLQDAPELGSIEIRRGFLGLWASVRVSRAGHQPGGAAHVMVGQAPAVAPAAMSAPAAAAAPAAAPAAPAKEEAKKGDAKPAEQKKEEPKKEEKKK